MLNRCEFIGNLGRDPEVRNTQAGKKVVTLNLAVTEKWKDQSGERKERTEWVRVVIFNEGIGGVAERYLSKGSRCYVSGQMATRKWTDQSGAEKYTTEIVLSQFDGKLVLLDGRDSGGDSGSRDDSRQETRGGGRTGGGYDLDGDTVPFAPLRELP